MGQPQPRRPRPRRPAGHPARPRRPVPAGAYLVTGNPGSGKSAVAAELAGRGYDALDTDEIAGWETAAGVPTTPPERVTAEWLRAHRWVWDRERLEDAIRARRPPVFLCGIAMNQRDMLDCFDLVFLLALDDATQLDRLDAPSNAGRNDAQRAQVRRGRPVFEREMAAAGAVLLDGRRPTADVVDRILRRAGPR